jgi:signal peptidase I
MSSGRDMDTTKGRFRGRKPLFALALSFFMTGLGHVYSGKPRKGVLIFLAASIIPLILFQISVVGPGLLLIASLGLSVAASFGIYIWAAVDAWKLAKRTSEDYRLKAYNKLALYLLLVVGWNLLSFGALVDLKGVCFWAAPYRMATGSMAPTLLQGDLVMTDRRVDHSAENHGLRRGELVVFKYPLDRNRVFVKRIVGLPGDEIMIKGMELSVNGKIRTGKEVPREERSRLHIIQENTIVFYEEGDAGTYAVQFFPLAERKDTVITVPERSCFVLGDNRDNSMDSRHWGMVPLDDIVARAKEVYFSVDPDDGVRWGRIGKPLENHLVTKSGSQSEKRLIR